jgi:hypothetical protein
MSNHHQHNVWPRDARNFVAVLISFEAAALYALAFAGTERSSSLQPLIMSTA